MHIHVPTSFEGAAFQSSGKLGTDLYFRHVGSYIVFDVDGPLALQWVGDELRAEVHQMLDGGRKDLILDLSDVPFMDSAGVGALVAVRTLILGAGGRLVLFRPSQRVMEMLKRLRLENLFTCSNDKTFSFART